MFVRLVHAYGLGTGLKVPHFLTTYIYISHGQYTRHSWFQIITIGKDHFPARAPQDCLHEKISIHGGRPANRVENLLHLFASFKVSLQPRNSKLKTRNANKYIPRTSIQPNNDFVCDRARGGEEPEPQLASLVLFVGDGQQASIGFTDVKIDIRNGCSVDPESYQHKTQTSAAGLDGIFVENQHTRSLFVVVLEILVGVVMLLRGVPLVEVDIMGRSSPENLNWRVVGGGHRRKAYCQREQGDCDFLQHF